MGSEKKKMVNNVEYVDSAWLAKTFIRGLSKVAINIGAHVWAFNIVTDEEIKN